MDCPTDADTSSDANPSDIFGEPQPASKTTTPAPDIRNSSWLLDARVLDAEWLDAYLFELLLLTALHGTEYSSSTTTTTTDFSPLSSSSTFVSSLFQWRLRMRQFKDDLALLFQLATLIATGTTPAARILGLEWSTNNSSSFINKLGGNTRLLVQRPQLVAYAALRLSSRMYDHYRRSVQSRLVFSRQQDYLRSIAAFTPQQHQQMDQCSFLALNRQALVCRVIDKVVACLRLIVWFGSWAGSGAATSSWCRTPNLAMFCSGNYLQPIMRQKSTPYDGDASVTKLHVDYAYRRWLWTESMNAIRILFAGFPLLRQVWQPVVDQLIQSTRLYLARCVLKLKSNLLFSSSHRRDLCLPLRSCPLCGLEPIRIPFQTNCGHLYCYTCLYKYTTAKAAFSSALHTIATPCCICRAPIAQAMPAHVQ